jgi:hypothetical protein
MPEDLAQYDELQPALVQLVEEARSDLDDGARSTAVLIAVRAERLVQPILCGEKRCLHKIGHG